MEKIVIVGINGFTGNQLLNSLILENNIIGIGRNENTIKKEHFKYIKLEKITINDIFESTYVIFCHNYKDKIYDQNVFHSSTSAVIKILNLALSGNKLKGIIYISSLAIYRGYLGGEINDNSEPNFDPNDWYAKTKFHEENIIIEFSKANQIKYLVLRSSAIVGPGFHGNLIFKIYSSLKSNSKLSIDNADIRFNVLVGILSIIRLVKNFINNENLLINKTYILSSYDDITLDLLVMKIKKILNSNSEIVWGKSQLRGPNLVYQINTEFKQKYLMTIDSILENIQLRSD